jgi:hypothetical protein
MLLSVGRTLSSVTFGARILLLSIFPDCENRSRVDCQLRIRNTAQHRDAVGWRGGHVPSHLLQR